jgi:hypothetical protein
MQRRSHTREVAGFRCSHDGPGSRCARVNDPRVCLTASACWLAEPESACYGKEVLSFASSLLRRNHLNHHPLWTGHTNRSTSFVIPRTVWRNHM